MAKVTILGGVGVVGGVVSKTLAAAEEFSQVIIADLDLKKAEEMALKLGDKVSAAHFDANDKDSVLSVMKGSDVIVNCTGPYYKFEKTILSAAIKLKINYVDVCDDTGATYDALALHEKAKEAGITALIGMGSSPGVTNLLAGYAANDLLDECDSIDMFHIHGGEPDEGAGVIGHRFYCMSVDIPMHLEGEAKLIKPENSAEYEEMVDFINLPGEYRVYPYPHPEPITMPMYIPGLKRVTNKGSVLPEKYYNLTRAIHACGLSSRDPIDVKGQQVVPHDFASAYLIAQRDKILKEMDFGEARGCVKIVVKGKKKKTLEPRTYVFSLVSEGAAKGQGLGEGTGIPAALGTILMAQGKIKEKGVLPPEACVPVWEFLDLMKNLFSVGEGRASPLIFQSIDGEGNVKQLEF